MVEEQGTKIVEVSLSFRSVLVLAIKFWLATVLIFVVLVLVYSVLLQITGTEPEVYNIGK